MNVNDTAVLARTLMDEFGLQKWRFDFDQATQRLGYCRYGTQTISLSLPYVMRNERSLVENTIRHEIAHALAGRGTGHGPAWRAQCVVTGARIERCADAAEVVAAPAPYSIVCEKCGYRKPRYRKTKTEYVHNRDGGTMVWEREGVS